MDTMIADPEGWPEPTILEVGPGVTTAVLRHEGVTLEDLPMLFDADYQRVEAVTVALEIPITGPAVAVYEGDPQGEFTVEIGFPVAVSFPATDEVTSSTMPGGRVAALTHHGAYDTLPEGWARLMEAAPGMRPGGRYAEIYVTEPSPEVDPATLRTDLVVELA